MTRIRTRFAALAILGVLSFGACARGDLPSESPLFRELRSGGVILYMRHSLMKSAFDIDYWFDK